MIIDGKRVSRFSGLPPDVRVEIIGKERDRKITLTKSGMRISKILPACIIKNTIADCVEIEIDEMDKKLFEYYQKICEDLRQKQIRGVLL